MQTRVTNQTTQTVLILTHWTRISLSTGCLRFFYPDLLSQPRLCKLLQSANHCLIYPNDVNHGGESRDLNDRVHGISCRYSDKTSK